MKVNIKGLAFVGFAAAIFAASAHADTAEEIAAKKKTVTSQYYAEQTYQTLANKLEQGEGTTAKLGLTDTNVDDTHYPTAKAVAQALASNASATTYTAGTGIDITSNVVTNSGVRSIATGREQDANGTIAVNTNGSTAAVAVKGLASAAYVDTTTDTTFAVAADTGKLPTASTVKSYVDATANAKVSSSNTISDSSTTTAPNELAVYTALSGKQPNLTGTATQVTLGNATYKDIVSSSANVDDTTHADTIPTTGAVAGAISAAITAESLGQYEEKANILDDDTTGDNNNTIANNATSTTKYPSAKAVVTYVGNQINTALPAGTAGNVLTYSGTAGTVNSLAIDTTVSNSSNLVTSGAVNTAINGLMTTYKPSGTTCNASTPCALVWAGDAPTWVNMAQ